MKENIQKIAKALNSTYRKHAVNELILSYGINERTADELYIRKGIMPQERLEYVLKVCQNALKLQIELQQKILLEN